MLFSSVVAQPPLECEPITPDKLVASVQDHLRSVGTLRGQAGCINTLPFGKRGRGVRILPTEIIPVRYMLADTDDELPASVCFKLICRSRESAGGQLEHPS